MPREAESQENQDTLRIDELALSIVRIPTMALRPGAAKLGLGRS